MSSLLPNNTVGMLQNQFLSGGILLMAVGAVGALARRVPGKIARWALNRFTLTVEVLNSDPAFAWIQTWLDAQPYSRKSRRLTISSIVVPNTDLEDESDADNRGVLLTPAPGMHLLFYKKRLVWLVRDRKDDSPGGARGGGLAAAPKESIELRLIGRSQQVVRDLVEDARKISRQVSAQAPMIHVPSHGYWNTRGHIPHRPQESVILPDGELERILGDVSKFLGSRKWYEERGIPYRRGYLLHGVPGMGKSSLVAVVAASLKLNLYVLNLGAPSVSDDSLMEYMTLVRPHSILLLEDIDAMTRSRRPRKKKKGDEDEDGGSGSGVTLSGLLNALDGVAAAQGILTVMTTNYRDRLDAALIRAGRVDYELPFKHADKSQIRRMFGRFYPEATASDIQAFAQGLNDLPVTMASLQEHCLTYRDSHQEAINNLNILRERINESK